MNITDLISRIWNNSARTDGMETSVTLTHAEWITILDDWPEIYGQTGAKFPPEFVSKMRDDWARSMCFYLYGHRMDVTLTD